MVVGLGLLTHKAGGLGIVWAHAGEARTILSHNRKGLSASLLLVFCVASLPSTGTPDTLLRMP